MKKNILHILNRLLLLLIAFQLLNLSVDGINFQPIQTSNLTEFNDLNSLTEYVGEIVLGHKNLFPEIANPDHHKQNQLQKHMDIKLYNPSVVYTCEPTAALSDSFRYPADDKDTFFFSRDINPPPPKA